MIYLNCQDQILLALEDGRKTMEQIQEGLDFSPKSVYVNVFTLKVRGDIESNGVFFNITTDGASRLDAIEKLQAAGATITKRDGHYAAILIFLQEPRTVAELVTMTNLQRPSVYGYLSRLKAAGKAVRIDSGHERGGSACAVWSAI